MSARFLAAFALAGIACLATNASLAQIIGGGVWPGTPGGGANNTALDCGGAACGHTNTSGTSGAVTLSTTATSGRVFVVVENNGTNVSSVTGGGLTFTGRLQWSNGAVCGTTSDCLSVFSAPFSSALSSATLTVNNSNSSGFMTIDAFAVSGQNGFDTDASLPAGGTTSPVVISTGNANDMLLCFYRFSSTSTPTEGAGFTKISGADFLLTEYKKVTATQSSFSCPIGTGNTDENAGIGDAVKSN
jgi:hypothetical protein